MKKGLKKVGTTRKRENCPTRRDEIWMKKNLI